MRDHETEELISAYLDGELDEDERAIVELTLRDSAEHRQLLEELKGLRASFSQFPRFELSSGFRDRLMKRLEESLPASSVTSVEPVSPVVDQESGHSTARRKIGWKGVLLAAASIAAVALVVVSITNRDGGQQIGPDGEFARPLRDPDEYFVYYREDKPPTLSLVLDLTISLENQRNEAFEKLMASAGIEIDDDLNVENDELQTTILNSRFIAGAADQAVQNVEEIELFYVVCELKKFDALCAELRERRHEFAPKFDVVQNPVNLDAMYRLNESSRARFADTIDGSKRSLAHRLVFSFKLNRSRLGYLGAISAPALIAQLLPDGNTEQDSSNPPLSPAAGKQSARAVERDAEESIKEATGGDVPTAGTQMSPQALSMNREMEEHPSEILFILRKLSN